MRSRTWFSAVAVAAGLFLCVSTAFAQQGGGGFGGGGGGGGFGGGGGGGGFGGGGGGGGAGQTGLNSSMLNSIQSTLGLPTILGRAAQGTFGTRTLGAPSRQRFRMIMGRSQAGGGMGAQFSGSGTFSQTRRGTLPGSGMMSVSNLTGMNNMQTQQQRGGGQPGQSGQQSVRRSNGVPLTKKVTVRVGFDSSGPGAEQVTAGLERRLSRVAALDSASVSVRQRTVVLRGSASTDHARDLAERLALLEPGIDAVRNELTTSPTLPAPQSLPRSPGGRSSPPPVGPRRSAPAGSPSSGPALGPGNPSSGS